MIWRPAVCWVCGRPAGGLEQGARGGRQGCGRGRSEGRHGDVCTRSSQCTAPDRPYKAGRPPSSWQEQMGCPALHGAATWRAFLSPANPVAAARPLGTACVEGAAAQQDGPRRLHRHPRLHGPRQAGDPQPPHCGCPGAPAAPERQGCPAAAACRLPPAPQARGSPGALQHGPACVGHSCSRRLWHQAATAAGTRLHSRPPTGGSCLGAAPLVLWQRRSVNASLLLLCLAAMLRRRAACLWTPSARMTSLCRPPS